MADQRRLILNPPIAVLLFDKTVMLFGTPHHGLTTPLDVMADLVGVDFSYRGGEIDTRTPSIERRHQRQLSQALAIALGRRASETPAFSPLAQPLRGSQPASSHPTRTAPAMSRRNR